MQTKVNYPATVIVYDEDVVPVGIWDDMKNFHCVGRPMLILQKCRKSGAKKPDKYYIRCACGKGYRTKGHKKIDGAMREWETILNCPPDDEIGRVRELYGDD